MYRDRIIELAETHVGEWSKWGNQTWCGMFVMSVYHDCGLARDLACDAKSGQTLRDLLPIARFQDGKPGDMVAWGKHVAILRHIDGTHLHTIDGTEGDGRVYTATRVGHRFNCVVHSIQPLIDAAAEWTGAESL